MGFVGIIFGLLVVAELIVGEGSKQRAFIPAAIVYLVFALPAFLLVREPVRTAASRDGLALRRAWSQFGQSFNQVRGYPRVFRFLGGALSLLGRDRDAERVPRRLHDEARRLLRAGEEPRARRGRRWRPARARSPRAGSWSGSARRIR